MGELVVVLMYVTHHPPSIRNTSLVRMLTREDLGPIQRNDFMATPAGAEWRATESSQVFVPHVHARSLSRLAVSRKAQVQQSDPRSTLQKRGNTYKARTVHSPDYLSPRESRNTTFQFGRPCWTYIPIRVSLSGQASATSPSVFCRQPSTR